jgi:CheY-like chemotaxis protein
MTQEDEPLKGRRFILLDEDRFTARMIQTLLPTLGDVTLDVHPSIAEVVTAANEALALPNGGEVIVLLDLDGEKRHGLTLLKQIRTGEAGLPRGLPVLALAGHSDQTLVLKAQELDVGAVLARPLSRAALHAACRRLSPGGLAPRPAESYAAVSLPGG